MHNLEYALAILGSKIEDELDPELGRRIVELASFSAQYQPPDDGTMPGGSPDESYLRKHIRIHDPNFTNQK